jgi:predicted dehydrogenase
MDDLRMAVVGAGRMGLTHAEHLERRVRGVRLQAVTTSSSDRAESVRGSCPSVAVYPDLDGLLESESLDAVVIASSTSAHVANVQRCAAAGLHILCEKPLALDLEGCDRAIAAADGGGVKLMVGHVRQFDSGSIEARRHIDSGGIGRPVLYRSLSGDTDPPPAGFADLMVSGGLILDSMYHDIYLARWLMDDHIVRVHGEGAALVDAGVRSVGDVDNAVVNARFSSGAMASMTASRVTRYGHDLRVEVIGDEGAIQIGRFRHTPVRILDRAGVHHDMARSTPQRMGGAFLTMLQVFVDCVREGREPPVHRDDARATVAVAVAATRSIQTGLPVELGDVARPMPSPGDASPGKEPRSTQ